MEYCSTRLWCSGLRVLMDCLWRFPLLEPTTDPLNPLRVHQIRGDIRTLGAVDRQPLIKTPHEEGRSKEQGIRRKRERKAVQCFKFTV